MGLLQKQGITTPNFQVADTPEHVYKIAHELGESAIRRFHIFYSFRHCGGGDINEVRLCSFWNASDQSHPNTVFVYQVII